MSYKWVGISVVLAVSLTGTYVSQLHSQISKSEVTIIQLTTDRDRLTADNATLQSNNGKLIASLDTLKESVSKFADESGKANKSFEEFSKQMNKRFNDISRKADKVFEEKKPETCVDAINYLVDAVPEYVK